MKKLSLLFILASIINLNLEAAFTRLATETYPGGGGGPTGGVTRVEATNIAANVVSRDVAPWAMKGQPKPETDLSGITNLIVASSAAATNYTDNATNALAASYASQLSYASQAATNYTDSATNALDVSHQSQMSQLSQSATNYTYTSTLAATNFVKAGYLPLAGGDINGDLHINGSDKILYLSNIEAEGMGDSIWVSSADSSLGVSRFMPDGTQFLTKKLAETDYPAITNAYAYTDTATNDLSAVMMAALCATNDLLKIYADRMGAADWSSTTAYVKGNFVWYTDETTPENTGLYVASGPGTNLPPPLNPDKWTKMDNANALFSQSNAQLSKNFLPWKGGVNAYVEWQGQNVRVYNGGLFARTLDLQAGFSNLKAYEGTSPYTSLPDYLRGATWNTAADPFAKKSDIPDSTNYYPFAIGNMVSNTVSQWEGYWTGSNVYWSVTNYIEHGNAKIMKLYEIQTNGVHREIWNDSDKYDIFFTNTLDAVSLTNNYTIGVVSNMLDRKADRAWGKYTSAGYDVPDTNMVWHTAPTTVFAGGFEFQKVAIAGGEIGVLVSQGSVPYAAGAEGKFIIGDGFGTNYFGYVKKDDYIIATHVDGITVDQATKMVSLDYNLVFSGEYPIVYYSTNVLPIASYDWIQLNKADGTLTPGAPWPVTFSTGSTNITAHISFAASTPTMPPKGFFTSSTAVIGGGTFKTNMKADFLDAGLMCTNTDTKVMGVIRPTFDGTTVHWNWSRQ